MFRRSSNAKRCLTSIYLSDCTISSHQTLLIRPLSVVIRPHSADPVWAGLIRPLPSDQAYRLDQLRWPACLPSAHARAAAAVGGGGLEAAAQQLTAAIASPLFWTYGTVWKSTMKMKNENEVDLSLPNAKSNP